MRYIDTEDTEFHGKVTLVPRNAPGFVEYIGTFTGSSLAIGSREFAEFRLWHSDRVVWIPGDRIEHLEGMSEADMDSAVAAQQEEP